MINWNDEEQTAITAKEQKLADAKAKIETEKQTKLDAQIAYKGYCVIFDQVIAEEIENIKIFLNKYAEFDIEVTTGNVKFTRYFVRGKHNCASSHDFSCIYKEGEDLANYTRERLISFVMWYTVNYK